MAREPHDLDPSTYNADKAYIKHLQEQANDKRMLDCLNLENKLDTNLSALKKMNAHRERAKRQRDIKKQEQFDAILSDGRNPYELFRQSAVQSMAERDKKKQSREIEFKRESILRELKREQKYCRKREATEKKRADMEKKYQAEISSVAHAERVKDYLVNRLGRETIDPSGRAHHIFPSLHVRLKPRRYAASAGNQRKLQQQIHPHRPAKPRTESEKNCYTDNDETWEDAHSGTCNANISLGKEDLETIHLPMIHTSSERLEKKNILLSSPQRSNNHQPKTCADFSKEVISFSTSFRSDPAVIWFKDFTVGRPQVIDFTLTNVSGQMNQFELLDFAQNEVFSISYEKLGSMSAGMSCRLRIKFSPSDSSDILTDIVVRTKLGICKIPLKCTFPKAIPVIAKREYTISDVFISEAKEISVKLRNDGLVPFEYRLYLMETLEADALCDDTKSHCSDGCDSRMNTDADIDQAHLDSQSPQESEAFPLDTSDNTTRTSLVNVNSVIEAEPNLEEACGPAESNVLETSYDDSMYTENELRYVDKARSQLARNSGGDKDPGDDIFNYSNCGRLDGYSTTRLYFSFNAKSAFDKPRLYSFCIRFHQENLTAIDPITISFLAQPPKPPVRISPQLLDFECCLYGKVHCQSISLTNYRNSNVRCRFKVRKPISKMIRFQPNVIELPRAKGMLGSVEIVQVSLCLQDSMWDILESCKVGCKSLEFFAVPIQAIFECNDNRIKETIILTARFTQINIRFSEQRIDFGLCALGSAVYRKVQVTNDSRVPETIRIIAVPCEISVHNGESGNNRTRATDDKSITLPPNQNLQLTLVYRPHATKRLSGNKLMFRTLRNLEYTLTCTGSGVVAPVVFSKSIVDMGLVQMGNFSVERIACTNTTMEPQRMLLTAMESFSTAEYTQSECLTVFPSTFCLEPEQTVSIDIHFRPIEERVVQGPDIEPSISIDPIVSVEKVSEEPQIHQEHIVISDENAIDSIQSGRIWYVLSSFQHDCGDKHGRTRVPYTLPAFQVIAATVPQQFLIIPIKLEFGNVILGHSCTQTCQVTNTSSREDTMIEIQSSGFAPFRVIGPLKCLVPANGTKELNLLCEPVYAGRVDALLTIKSSYGIHTISLSGEAVTQTLLISTGTTKDEEAKSSTCAEIDFGDVLRDTMATNDIILSNPGPCPLYFLIEKCVSTRGSGNTVFRRPEPCPFMMHPSNATIPPNGNVSVRATFCPIAEEHIYYETDFIVRVRHSDVAYTLSLTGSCRRERLFIEQKGGSMPLERSIWSLARQHLLKVGAYTADSALDVNYSSERAVPPLIAEFTASDIIQTKQFVVGCAAGFVEKNRITNSDLTSQAAGTFELIFDTVSPYLIAFAVDPVKGSVQLGERLNISVTFDPQKLQGEPLAGLSHSVIQISEELQIQLNCTLRGGDKSKSVTQRKKGDGETHADTMRTISILLKAAVAR